MKGIKTMLNNIGEACTACRACEQICPNSAFIFEIYEFAIFTRRFSRINVLGVDCVILFAMCKIQFHYIR